MLQQGPLPCLIFEIPHQTSFSSHIHNPDPYRAFPKPLHIVMRFLLTPNDLFLLPCSLKSKFLSCEGHTGKEIGIPKRQGSPGLKTVIDIFLPGIELKHKIRAVQSLPGEEHFPEEEDAKHHQQKDAPKFPPYAPAKGHLPCSPSYDDSSKRIIPCLPFHPPRFHSQMGRVPVLASGRPREQSLHSQGQAR